VAYRQHPERRRFSRHRTSLYATLSTPSRASRPCLVVDLSEGGAKVEVDFPEWQPARFHLAIGAAGFDADCEVVRRGDSYVGVRFVPLRARA
jgi:hypothetical protein